MDKAVIGRSMFTIGGLMRLLLRLHSASGYRCYSERCESLAHLVGFDLVDLLLCFGLILHELSGLWQTLGSGGLILRIAGLRNIWCKSKFAAVSRIVAAV